jgi:hypothetical protein
MITIRRHTAATLLVAVASAAATMLGSTATAHAAGEVQGATGDMLRIAQVLALHKLSNQTGAHIVLSGCATPQPVGVRTFAGVVHIG